MLKMATVQSLKYYDKEARQLLPCKSRLTEIDAFYRVNSELIQSDRTLERNSQCSVSDADN